MIAVGACFGFRQRGAHHENGFRQAPVHFDLMAREQVRRPRHHALDETKTRFRRNGQAEIRVGECALQRIHTSHRVTRLSIQGEPKGGSCL